MKVSPLLAGVAGLTLIALTATTLYAQTATGTSLVDKMKAVAHTFTLSADLNAGQTGFESAPYYYVNAVAPTELTWQFGNFVPEETWHISASSKNVLLFNTTPYTATSGNVTKIEKRCN